MGFFPIRLHGRERRRSRSRLGREQQPHRSRPVVRLELADGFLDVTIDGLRRDGELPADLLGGPVQGGEAQTLPLARRQAV